MIIQPALIFTKVFMSGLQQKSVLRKKIHNPVLRKFSVLQFPADFLQKNGFVFSLSETIIENMPDQIRALEIFLQEIHLRKPGKHFILLFFICNLYDPFP